MPMYDIGPLGFTQGQAVATLSQTPLVDRANIITRLLVDKVSASDTWVLSCAGRELARFDLESTGNQQILANPYSGYPKNNDLFALAPDLLNVTITYPVPQGQSITIASVGGATANIEFQFQEVSSGEISQGMPNHPAGNRFILPLYLYRNANVTAAGEAALDSQIGPSWFPNLAVANALPPNWNVTILGMFLEGGGVNTFSGAANHQSVTTYFAAFRNGQRLFTRASLGGIPLVGQASAAGSANVVIGTDTTPLPPFQEVNVSDWAPFQPTLVFQQGGEYSFALNISGDVTGGAGYGSIRQLFLVDVRTMGGF